MMSKYQSWVAKQPKEFKELIHKTTVPINYINEDNVGISLEELEALDNKHVLRSEDRESPEGGE